MVKKLFYPLLCTIIVIMLIPSITFAQQDEQPTPTEEPATIPTPESTSSSDNSENTSPPQETGIESTTAETVSTQQEPSIIGYYKGHDKALILGTVSIIDVASNSISVESRTGEIRRISLDDATILLCGKRITIEEIPLGQRVGVMGVEKDDTIYPTRPVIVHPNKSSIHHVTGVIKRGSDNRLALEDSTNAVDIAIPEDIDTAEGEIATCIVETDGSDTTQRVKKLKHLEETIERIGNILQSGDTANQGICPEHEALTIIKKLGDLSNDIEGDNQEKIRERIKTALRNHMPEEAWGNMPTEAGENLEASAWGYIPDEAFQYIQDKNFEYIPPEAYDHIKDTAYQYIRPEAFGYIREEAFDHMETSVVEQCNPDVINHMTVESAKRFRQQLGEQQNEQVLDHVKDNVLPMNKHEVINRLKPEASKTPKQQASECGNEDVQTSDTTTVNNE